MASPQWDILAAVQTALQGIAGFSGVTVNIRERPFHSTDHGDGLPMVCVSPGKEKPKGYFMPSGVEFDWQVIIAIFQAKDGVVQSSSDMQWRIARRWDVFQALGRTTLSGVSKVRDFSYDPNPLVDLPALGEHIKVSLQMFGYTTTETRGGGG